MWVHHVTFIISSHLPLTFLEQYQKVHVLCILDRAGYSRSRWLGYKSEEVKVHKEEQGNKLMSSRLDQPSLVNKGLILLNGQKKLSFNSAEGVGWLGGLCTMKFPSWLPAYIVAAGGTNHTFMIKWHVGFHHSLYFFMWFNAKITSFWCNSHRGKLTGPLYKMTMATWYKKHLSKQCSGILKWKDISFWMMF